MKFKILIGIIVVATGCSNQKVNYKELTNQAGKMWFQGSEFTGIAFMKYDNQKDKFNLTFKNGEINGICTSFWINGNEKYRGNIISASDKEAISFMNYGINELPLKDLKKIDGDWLEYFENGKLKASYFFKDGHLDKEMTVLNFEGDTIEHVLFKNGKYDGDYISYFKKNKPKVKCVFKNNKIVGQRIEYWYNGNIKEKSNFNEDGLLEGDFIAYYKTGQIQVHGNYNNGKVNNEWSLYDKNGTLIRTSVTINGQLEPGNFQYEIEGDSEDEGKNKQGVIYLEVPNKYRIIK